MGREGRYDAGPMQTLIIALAEAGHTAKDLEEDLLPVAIALFAIALIAAAVVTWRVTPRESH